MFDTILVPVDVAQESSWRDALPDALQLARIAGGKLVVVTVVRDMTAFFESAYLAFDLERMKAEAHAKLTRIIREFDTEGVNVDVEVRYGRIGEEILSTAAAHHVDLILMASHRPELRDVLIGPNAAHVARHAPCSVFVLRR